MVGTLTRRALALAILWCAAEAAAQTGSGSLRGYVRDEQGAVLPGVTVTATSPAVIGAVTATTDSEGYYRLLNLPPGEYVLTAELPGFATFRREGILLRAGANFQVDITMKLGALAETITVTGESPMLEVARPGNVLNIDGEFQKQMPIAARRNWTDFLELTPGVHSRPFDDGSGRMVYFGHATEHFAHVVQLEGMQAGNYNDFQLTYIQMGADMIEDVQVKTGGVDASTPMGTGLAINVITKSGGNQFRGTAGYAYQPLGWNDDNTRARTVFRLPPELAPLATAGCPGGECVSTGGSPTQAGVNQFDASLGGPIVRDRVWFFGSLRVGKLEAGISRIDKQTRDIQAYFPGRELFNNWAKGYQPYLKVTAKLGPKHDLQVFYQRDRVTGTNNWEWYFDPFDGYSNGGDLVTGKLTSLWGGSVTTTFTAGYNNKGGNNEDTYRALNFEGSGPRIEVYESTRISSGLITGSNLILEGNNRSSNTYAPASLIMLRGDITWYKEGFAGSHEFQTGFFAEPRNTYDQRIVYLNDGFILERLTPVDPANPARGLRPFFRRYVDPLEITTRQARDSNYAVYVQDSWKPSPRLTASLGLRADYVKRVDKIFDVVRESAWTIQPRLGFSYLVTADARNVLRASYARLGEQVMGRDAITTFGGDNTVSVTEWYDNDLDGVFETRRFSPATTASIAGEQIDPRNHQPYLDEFIVGFRRQFPMQTAVDVAFISRSYKHMWATVEINGFWPEAPGQPFGGWGRIDPNRGAIQRQTNNTWSTLEYRAVELTLTKNMTHGFQVMAGFNRQWHHMAGTWNPTDPARFIQPEAFPNDKNLYMPRGNNDGNSLPDTGNALSYGPTWMKYRGNVGGTWLAPWGVRVAASYTIQAGPWSGAILRQLPANDPDVLRFGPARFTLPNGTTQPNPLATRNRYVYRTRGEGQLQAPAIHTVGLKVGKVVRLGGGREVEIAGNVFNLFNAGRFTQFSYNSAYQSWSTNFLQMRNRQPARAFQLTAILRY
ncbi:MAG TPA: TonB-dependent receptor [Vicinamibacterales bacterium]|nr:TonB-dependent receptor [Vicinamibacterales bacterium]